MLDFHTIIRNIDRKRPIKKFGLDEVSISFQDFVRENHDKHDSKASEVCLKSVLSKRNRNVIYIYIYIYI